MKDYELIERLEKLKKQVLISRVLLVLELVVIIYALLTDKNDDHLYIIIGIIVLTVIIGIFSVPKQLEVRKLQKQIKERNDA